MNYHVRDVRPGEADLLLDLARSGMRLVETAGSVQPEREKGDDTRVGAQEAKLARLRPRDLPDDPTHDLLTALPHLGGRPALRQRLEVRLDALDLRHRRANRRLEALGDRMGLLQRQLSGQLHVERELAVPVDVDQLDVVDLADVRD